MKCSRSPSLVNACGRRTAGAALAVVFSAASVALSLCAQTNPPGALPQVKTRDVMERSGDPTRVRITGTKLIEFAPGYFFLHDDTGHVRVHLAAPAPLQYGDLVEVSGVPTNLETRPWLELAEARVIGRGVIPTPRRIQPAEAAADLYNGEYVTIAGRVTRHAIYKLLSVTNEVVQVEADGVFCKVMFTNGTDSVRRFPVGTVGEFTGIIRLGGRVDEGDNRYLHLLVHSPNDVRVLRHPPFWTPAALQVLWAVSAVAAIAAIWILWQRRKNAELEQHVVLRTAELRDEVAAREQAEAELRVALQAEKELNQLKSSFVSMVSHEFRTPLGIILSSSNILDRYLDRLPPEKRRAQLRAIRKAVHHMNDLIEDVLLLGKFEAGALNCQPVPLELAAFCRSIAGEIESAAAREGAIVFSSVGALQNASADEGLLHHILANILGNAVKYSAPQQTVDFNLSRSGPDAVFVIRDQGCGIPPGEQARLFTAFYRGSNVSQKPGSGLGLVIAKRCVDLHGGSVRCESQPGVGTTFTVTLPLFDGTRIFRRGAGTVTTSAH